MRVTKTNDNEGVQMNPNRWEYINEGQHTEKLVVGGEVLAPTITGHTSVFFDAAADSEIEVLVYDMHGYEDGEAHRSGVVEDVATPSTR